MADSISSKGISKDIRELLETGLGHFASKRVTGTDATVPDDGYVFIGIQAETDTVINTTTGNVSNFDGAGITAEGVRLGRWTSVTLTSGSVILYQGVV